MASEAEDESCCCPVDEAGGTVVQVMSGESPPAKRPRGLDNLFECGAAVGRGCVEEREFDAFLQEVDGRLPIVHPSVGAMTDHVFGGSVMPRSQLPHGFVSNDDVDNVSVEELDYVLAELHRLQVDSMDNMSVEEPILLPDEAGADLVVQGVHDVPEGVCELYRAACMEAREADGRGDLCGRKGTKLQIAVHLMWGVDELYNEGLREGARCKFADELAGLKDDWEEGALSLFHAIADWALDWGGRPGVLADWGADVPPLPFPTSDAGDRAG